MKSTFRNALTLALTMAFTITITAAKPPGDQAERLPNFVLILTDDQGYSDLGCFGGKHVRTPRIDQMAKEGARLTSFYVAGAVCTPSRAALMTGCYPKRVGLAAGVFLAGDKHGLNPQEVTIAEVLKGAGYKTGIFGKWHLGDQPEFLPTRQGFDEFFGLPYSHDIHPFHLNNRKYNFPPLPLLEMETVIEEEPDADYLTKRFTGRAVRFIAEHKDEPFFLYVPHPIPHRPIHMSPPFMEKIPAAIRAQLKDEERIDYKTRDKIYNHAISEIDWSVGQILDALKQNGLDENTLVIFTSDNGPSIGSAKPLRGGKGSTLEGGMRMPTVIRWPSKIPPGQDNDALTTAMDLLPTFARLAGAKIPADRIIDGNDIWPVLSGKAKTPHEKFFYHRGNELKAVRSGKWKLHASKGRPNALFNLESDIRESKNVLKANPKIVERLDGYLKEFAKDIAANNRPPGFVKNPKPLTMTSAKTSATKSKASARFDFESGQLEPWKVIEGRFAHVIGSREHFFNKKGGSYDKQGKYYLTTLEIEAKANRRSDKQTGVIVSPLFVPKGGQLTFQVGGGRATNTYVALCQADGTELKTARGNDAELMKQVSWDLTAHAGKKLFLKVVDQRQKGWAHVTADNFQFDGEILDEYPDLKKPTDARKKVVNLPAPQPQNRPAAKPHNGQAERLNLVVIFTDDQGYGDLGCYGSTDVHTPHIDRMAAEGMKLTSFYVAAPYCTPSRAALMTGCYPQRIGMGGGVLLSADKRGLNPKEETIAEVLKSAGYKTGMFGKWHLGDQPAFLPTRQGFDEFFGLPYSHDIHPHNPKANRRFPPLPLLEGEEVIELEPDADFLTKRFTERAVRFIAKHKDHPFFLYVPHPIPHRPNHMTAPFMEGISDEIRKALAEEKVTGKINYEVRDKLYFRAVNEIDWSVGQILDALKNQGIDDNTVVLFTSDNGQARPPVGIGSAGPLKGAKGMTWEGGMRMPTVIRCPGHIAANTEVDEILTAMDLLPTFARLAGAQVPADRVIDGKDIWPVLTEGATSPHEAFFYHRVNSLQAVRAGKWKLHLGRPGKHGAGNALFDLEADIGETTDVKAKHPEVVARLRALVKPFQQDLAQNSRPAASVKNPKPLTKQ